MYSDFNANIRHFIRFYNQKSQHVVIFDDLYGNCTSDLAEITVHCDFLNGVRSVV